MPYTEHTVVYEQGGTRREVTRDVFTTSDGRICGTHTEITHRYMGYDGWQFTGTPPLSKAFATADEASDWMDEMFREHQLWKVAQQGGTKLVIVS